MSFHRIKKYSRQIVCQDCVLSCQPGHIEEIPLLKRAKVSSLSLRNQRTTPGEGRSTLLERDLDLSGMLMCWHLWNSRSVPFFATRKRADSQRRALTGKRERTCNSLLTLRDQRLYMAIEKYLLFLMPREMRRERILSYPLDQVPSRRGRSRLSAFYVYTALGLCQYKIAKQSFASSGGQSKAALVEASQSLFDERSKHIPLALSPEKMFFPNVSQVWQSTEPTFTCSLLQSKHSLQDLSQSISKEGYNHEHIRVRGSLRKTLSLYCPSVLSSPDIQDVAQSGLVTLEGSFTLELV